MLLRKTPNPSSQLDAIFRAYPDLLFTLDAEGVILDYRAGDAVSTLFVPPEAFLGQRAEEVLPREFADSLANGLKELGARRRSDLLRVFGQAGRRATLVRGQAGSGRAGANRGRGPRCDPAQAGRGEDQRPAQAYGRPEGDRSDDLVGIGPQAGLVGHPEPGHFAVSGGCCRYFAADRKGRAGIRDGVGFRTDARHQARLRMGEGFAGKAAADQRTIHVPDVRRAKTGVLRPPQFAEEGFRCYYGVPLIAKGRVHGVLEIFHRSPLQPDAEWLDFMETMAGQAAIAIENGMLLTELQRTNLELTLAYNTTIEGWSRALDLRDRDTEGHTKRVTQAAVKLGRRLGLNENELIHVRRGAMLHDIGKMAIPDSILLKPGPLTNEEWEMIRQHTRYAYELLWPISYLGPAIDIPHFHHERWDGSGYPDGLKGNEIPLAARLFAVIDVFDALTSPRPYRAAWDRAAAIDYVRDQRGRLFDPDVADEFTKMLEGGEALSGIF